MAHEPQPSLQDKVRMLRERYASSVGDKMIEINAAYDKLVGEVGGDNQTVAIDGLMAPIHKMAGSAPTFGRADLGEIAGKMEELLLSCRDSQNGFSKEQETTLSELMEALRQTAAIS
jgi:HPt (histidine-containing phosphotransfer) domain-containing protein